MICGERQRQDQLINVLVDGLWRERKNTEFLSDHVETFCSNDIRKNQADFAHQDLGGTNTRRESSQVCRNLPLRASQNRNRHLRFTLHNFILPKDWKRPIPHLKLDFTRVVIIQ